MHKTRAAIDQQQAAECSDQQIIFIGPEWKATWIGSENGLRSEYPYAKIITISPIESG